MKAKSIKIPYGVRNGEPIHVSDVERGLACDCVCLACKKQLVARKGEKKGHHFAHYKSPECSAETVLHYYAKRLLERRIFNSIEKKEKLQIKWSCAECEGEHVGNIVKKAATVAVEENIGPCRPDLTIFDNDHNPVLFVEIVVSHKPEDYVYEYVKENKLGLLEFRLKDGIDLEALENSEVLFPKKVYPCTRPKCNNCGKPLREKTLHITEKSCWFIDCESNLKIAFMNIEGCMIGPEKFR